MKPCVYCNEVVHEQKHFFYGVPVCSLYCYNHLKGLFKTLKVRLRGYRKRVRRGDVRPIWIKEQERVLMDRVPFVKEYVEARLRLSREAVEGVRAEYGKMAWEAKTN